MAEDIKLPEDDTGAKGIAHDLRNLMTVLHGILPLLDTPDPAARRELVAAAEKALGYAAELAGQFLDPSRSAAGAAPLDLNAIVHEVASLLRRTTDPRITLEVRVRGPLPLTRADPTPLFQVVLNLCLNACDAMPQGGRLRLDTGAVTLRADDVQRRPGSRPGSFVYLRVIDTGHGIAPEVRARVFDPYFTTKRRGQNTGLGLAIVRDVVRRCEGWVECTSAVGQGTCFEVFLPSAQPAGPGPAAPPAVLPPEPVLSPAPAGSHPGRVLLVDNDETILLLARTILERSGFEVKPAASGHEAVAKYRQERDDIDVVVVDQNMPGLSGLETAARLLEVDPEVRVLLMSGSSAFDLAEDLLARVHGFLAKPYKPDQLVEAVRAAIGPPRDRRG